jgi:hypothetical protein
MIIYLLSDSNVSTPRFVTTTVTPEYTNDTAHYVDIRFKRDSRGCLSGVGTLGSTALTFQLHV